MSYGAGAPSPGTSKLFSGAPPSTKQVFVDGEATTLLISLHATRNLLARGDRTSRPSSETMTSSFHVGDSRYAAPSATPVAPIASGASAAPSATSDTPPARLPMP